MILNLVKEKGHIKLSTKKLELTPSDMLRCQAFVYQKVHWKILYINDFFNVLLKFGNYMIHYLRFSKKKFHWFIFDM
jgi:flavorubredoxin